MNALPLSAVIITLNEEKNIRQCLSSLSFCDDIVVVDSHSKDATTEIAKECGARVFEQTWLGYGPQKQFAVEQAKYDWVLCIDADEVISEELARSIQQINWSSPPEKHAANGYLIPRCNHFLQRPLRHGEGYPDLCLRLFHRNHGHWSDDIVHEGVQLRGQASRLTGDLLHYSEDTIAKYLSKQNHYTSLQAQLLFERGKPSNALKCFSSPLIRFIKFYIVRLGFLDGLPGFIHISIGCFNAFSKYAKLAELHANKHTDQNKQNTTKVNSKGSA